MAGRTGLADPATAGPNIFSMVPERLADAISEVLNSKNRQLGRRVFLITRLKHMKQCIEFCVKQMGSLLHFVLASFVLFHSVRPLNSLR